MNAMLTSYLNAVIAALKEAGVATFGHGADTEDGRPERLHIYLADKWADESPLLVWSPEAGWRVGVAVLGAVPPETIRYVHAGAVPSPAYVAESVGRWQADASALTDVEPAYEVEPSRLDGLLAEAAEVPAAQELAAAIRDALNLPHPADDWASYERLLSSRAAYIVGALGSLAGAPDMEDVDRDARVTAHTVRDVAAYHPVAYETKGEADR